LLTFVAAARLCAGDLYALTNYGHIIQKFPDFNFAANIFFIVE
jgi:hypothetical protein